MLQKNDSRAHSYTLNRKIKFFLIFLCLISSNLLYAACGGTVRTWDAGNGNNSWGADANWSDDDEPDTTSEDAVIVSAARPTRLNQTRSIGCLEVLSGELRSQNNTRTLTITGDYFRARTAATLDITASHDLTFNMGGTSSQSIEILDPINHLTISNDTDVTIESGYGFELRGDLNFTGTSSTLKVHADLNISNTGAAVTIPSGITMEVSQGATVTFAGGVVVNGSLKVQPGSAIVLGNGSTLQVNSGGVLQINGADGNTSSVSAVSGSFTFNMAGNLTANYFSISRTDSNGLNVTGTIASMSNGEFHNIASAGDAMTWGASASIPSTLDTMGFFDDDGHGNNFNIDATSFNVSDVTINNWSGLDGSTYERDSNNRITWGTQAGTALTLTTNNNSGKPVDPVTAGSAADEFAIFAFNLNQASTATDITEVTFTLTGTGSSSDIDYIQVFNQGGTCQTVGTQIGSNLTMSGTPATATISIPGGTVSTDGTSAACIHVYVKTTDSAENAKTIGIEISATDDVTNSQGYEWSGGSSPPVSASSTTISGDPTRIWDGSSSSNWRTNSNWINGSWPGTGENCSIGNSGANTVLVSEDNRCQNMTLPTTGEINWNNTSFTLGIEGAFEVQSGYTFTGATNGTFEMLGTSNQTLSIATALPNDLVINNSGGLTSIISVTGDSTVNGDVIVTSGTLKVLNGMTLTVLGNITVQTGAALEIEKGGTLALGNGSILTVDSGGLLTLVGESGTVASITSDSGSSAYSVVINGTIAARYYSFDHLGVNGVSIESTATIDSSNHLQDGSFSYPVNNNSTFLFLKQQVPTNTLNDMTFSLGGSSATGTTTIDTTGATAGTLTLDNYSGDLTGADYDSDPSYLLSWLGATNTILITQEATGVTSFDAGSTYTMGRFGFQQESAGASFGDADITSLKLTLTGTGTSNDVDEVRIYYDSNCDGLSGTLIGTGSFAGNPATKTFSIGAGSATVEADNASPPKRCIYVEYDIALSAVDGNTVGVEINASTDIVNDQSYLVSTSTPTPINLGTAGTITGATETSWTGSTNTDWATASNWTAGVPDSSTSCTINSASNNPVIAAGTTGTCNNLTIGTGSLSLANSTSTLEVFGSYDNTSSGSFTQNSGTFRLSESGSGSTQSIASSDTIESLTFNKTLGGGSVGINGSSLTITTLSIPGGSDFTFNIANGKTLILGNSFTLSAGVLQINNGATLQMPNGSLFTVNSGGILKMIGANGDPAIMTTASTSQSFEVNINTGEIQAEYYEFKHLGTNGVTIGSSATIDTTYHLQNGAFKYPVSNSATLLNLGRQVPSNILSNMIFDLDGSSATSTTNINTSGASAGTLTINSYSGDLSGPSFDADSSYAISWSGAQNTILISQEATGPTNVNAGSTYNMGRFGFKQALAGASFNDTDIGTFRIKLLGTNNANDVDWVRVYYDSDCDSVGGTLIDAGSFSGSPATATFSLTSGEATIPANTSTTEMRCIYIEYDVAAGATDANTIGVEISADSYFSNTEAYAIDGTTPTPIDLGTVASISGSSDTTWTGATNTDWFTASNWSAGLPDATKSCIIEDVTNDPVIGSAGAICNSLTNNGAITMTNASGATLDVYADLYNTGSITQNDGVITLTDSGGGTDNTLNTNSAISSLTFNKTSGGEVLISSGTTQINTLSFPSGSNFTFKIPSGVTLKTVSSFTVNGATFWVDQGGTFALENSTTMTIASDATLKLIGSSGSYAKITGKDSGDAYNVVVDGTIQAQYYTFESLNTTGVNISSSATIDSTYHLQDCRFTKPINNSTTLLTLGVTVPTDTMNNCHFDLDGSSATGTVTVDTSSIGSSGTLTFDTYTGGLAGPANDNPGTYDIAWNGALNTIDITAEANTPASMTAGTTYNVGRYGFSQTSAGASYSDADITTLKITLTGTASASDIDEVRAYYDSDCNSSGGALIGTNTFSGSPETITFTFSAGQATVEADSTTPPMRCIYFEYDIAAGATNNVTAGVRIANAGDFATDIGYTTESPPIDLGSAGTIIGATTTTWTGSTDTDWSNASNWSAGVPDSAKSCNISDVANDPIIGSGVTAQCDNLNSSNGIITFADATTVLEIYGNYSNTGSLTDNGGTIRIVDSASTTQTLESNSDLSILAFNKSGGLFRVNSSINISNLSLSGTDSMEFEVPSGVTLTLPNGVTLAQETFTIQGGATVEIGNGSSIVVSGGTFQTTGTEDQYPQNESNKAKVTVQTSGTWGFNATSGTVSLGGFLFDYIDVNGLRINGSTTLSKMKGGQFTNLSNSYASVKAIQFNSTGSFPATADWIGFNWNPNNSTPANTEAYTLINTTGSGCNGGAIDFTGWFGDWVDDTPTFDVDTKVSATNCTVGFGNQSAASAVTITKFEATPFNGAVDLKWETSFEQDHLGFNVYRSQSEGSGYIRINTELVRNINMPYEFRGKYRFIDNDVKNDQTYFYYIEDIEVDQVTTTIHGPVIATPNASLGNPSADEVDENSGSNSDNGDDSISDPGTISNDSFKDLGDGVVILSQTNSSIRIEVTTDTPIFTTAAWDSSYEQVSLPGYTKTLTAGAPEILERTVLIEVNESSETVNVIDASISEVTDSGRQISPAPDYVYNSSTEKLEASWSIDSSVYSTNARINNSFYQIENNLVSVGSKKYIKLIIKPLDYNPVTQDLFRASRITLDLALDGNDWGINNPTDSLNYAPGIVGNTLRIAYKKEGIYEVSFDDLIDSNVEGPFDGINTTDLRLYHEGVEIPLQVISSDSIFSSGDAIRFFAPYKRSFEDLRNYVILSTIDILDSGDEPMRMESIDGDPAQGIASPDNGTYYHYEREDDNFSILNDPVGVGRDLFYWGRMFAPYPAAPQFAYTDVSVSTPTFDTDSNQLMSIKLHVKGSPLLGDNSGVPHFGEEVTHNIAVFINGSIVPLDDITFEGSAPQEITIKVENRFSGFVAGNNTIRIKNMATYVPAGGAYDMIYLNKIEVDYWGTLQSTSDNAVISNPEVNSNIQATDFSSSDITVYDISNKEYVSILENTSITANGGNYDVEFFTNEDNGDLGYKYIAIADGATLTPTSLTLSAGYEPLKDSNRRADLLVVGNIGLITSAYKLIEARKDQGLSVATITLDQIYNEFSNGLVSSEAIRDFVTYTQNYWDKKPKYLLILGDATYDPLDNELWESDAPDAAYTTPMPMVSGRYINFGSDNWFVNGNSASHLPTVSMGRLPTNDPEVISRYVDKILAYENGELAPDLGVKNLSFIADKDTTDEEDFKGLVDELADLGRLSQANFSRTVMDSEEYATNTDVKNAIIDKFDEEALVLTFMGHGATDLWSKVGVFSNSEAENLTNSKLPIVVAFNCENNYFYDPYKETKSLSEAFVFNENGGAVAFLGSSTLTTPTAQMKMAQAFYSQLGNTTDKVYDGSTIGDVLLSAKNAVGDGEYTRDMIESFSLIGDPSMPLPKKIFKEQTITKSSGNSSGGGCSAVAANGERFQTPWYAGVLNLLFLCCFSVLLNFLYRRLFRKVLQ